MTKICEGGKHKMVSLNGTKNKICEICKRYYILWADFENDPKELKESRK